MLEFLVYVSTAVRDLSADELSYLVKRAAERNATENVTGMLLYSDGDFMQCLEGPSPSLQKIYGIICADPLHRGIILLAKDKLQKREFADWHMAFHSPDRNLKSLTGLTHDEILKKLEPGASGSRARALLQSFCKNHQG